MIVKATYTSVFDDSIVCTSACMYDTEAKRCFDIEPAENAEAADRANNLTDEYVMVDGEQFRNGVAFDY